jgi:hypothetical protein
MQIGHHFAMTRREIKKSRIGRQAKWNVAETVKLQVHKKTSGG